MSWKFVNSIHPFRSPSIIKQLTLMFSVTTFVLLSMAAYLLYSVLVHNLNYSDINIAQRELFMISQMINQSTQNTPLKEEAVLRPLTLQKHNYYCRILDGNKKLIYAMPNMEALFPASVFPQLKEKKNISLPVFYKAPNHRHYVLRSMYTSDKSGKVYEIQLAYDTYKHYPSLTKYRTILFLILLSGLIICPLISLFIAKRGLAPLKKLTLAIEKVQINNLHTPLSTENCPRELLKLIKAFNALMLRLEGSFNQLSQFSADLAHELRTPIHNLINHLEITLTRPRQVEDYQTVLISSLEECSDLGNLIDRLLFLARAENPNMAIELSSINLDKEIHNLIDFFDAEAEEKQITIHYDDSHLSLSADMVLFKRALINLISNAIKYTHINGKIRIRAYQQEQNSIIEVSDNGCGIDNKHLPFIFSRFYRAEFARSKQTGGHGLGLAIVKTIMELHRGQVEVDSTLNKGSVFRLIFLN